MRALDWIILFLTLGLIAAYGIYKNKKSNSLSNYLNSGNNTPWWAIGLSIMATQASAITFLSTPGMGYESGLGFVQFYFGMPIALLIVAFGFAPLFHKQKVQTAYEYLENRFDLKVRMLAAVLFLIQRGLAAGITIYAPSIVLSLIMGWPLWVNILIIGTIVIAYTVTGGDKAVTQTHMYQMAVIFLGIFIAFGAIIYLLQPYASFSEVVNLAKITGRLKSIDTTFDLNNRYNIWSGLIGGTFLMLSYFGTDQSQVQRYLSGKDLKEIRTGLFFNAIFKIPMQYFILFTGVLLFVFYQFHQPPANFDKQSFASLSDNEQQVYNLQHNQLFEAKKEATAHYIKNPNQENLMAFQEAQKADKQRLVHLRNIAKAKGYKPQVKETDFVFITFILDYLPAGIVGLLLAVIFSAAMSSTSAELSALSTTSSIDIYKRLINPNAIERKQLIFARFATLIWGVLAILFALMASMFENLVEAVNILGSLFYGTVLGIFLASLFTQKKHANTIFWSAVVAQILVLILFFGEKTISEKIGFEVSFLWFNLIAVFIICITAFFARLVQSEK